jgi:hypothetical protein
MNIIPKRQDAQYIRKRQASAATSTKQVGRSKSNQMPSSMMLNLKSRGGCSSCGGGKK